MNAANQRQLTPALAALAAVLGLIVLLLLGGVGRRVHWDAPRTMAPLPATNNAADLPRPLPLQDFAMVWERPLFSPDRKPTARVTDGGTALGDLQLTGIILTPGLRMALLYDKNGDRQVRLREGGSLPDGSVTLLEVRPRSAVFDSSTGRTELKLPAGAPFDDQKSSTPANPGAPAAAAVQVAPNPPVPSRIPSPASSSSQAPGSFVERIREDIKRRRAARAAAATH